MSTESTEINTTEKELVLLSTKAVSNIIGAKPQTIARWRCEGSGPEFVKVGSLVRYMMKDIESWIEQQKRNNTI